jgi:pimeloyl-ACP methyl ester carboxylesterase
MSNRTAAVRLWAALTAAGLAFGTVSGCTEQPAGPVHPPSENFSDCGNEVPPGGQKVSFPNAQGALLQGMIYGTGTVGLALAHQSDGNMCQWDPFVKYFVDKGYRALEFDFSGFGKSPQREGSTVGGDVVAAADFLRVRGATKIVLIGGSLGGAAVVDGAARIKPPVTAVADISGSGVAGLVDLRTEIGKITMPILFLSTERDSAPTAVANLLFAATKAPGKELVVIKGKNIHGIPVLRDPQGMAALEGFLGRNAPPE